VSINCYTDASCHPNQSGNVSAVACVVVVNGSKKILSVSGRAIGDFNSSTAELIAICFGLDETAKICQDLELPLDLVRICSDCESALDLCVGESEPSSAEVEKILESIRRLSLRFRIVEFQWVRGHANNKFNELADSVAYQIAQG